MIDVEGRKERVLPRDYQLDVVTDRPLHVDFLRLRAGTRVRANVPVHVINREAAPGVKKGGTVNIVRHTMELLAPAENIPEAIEVDLTGMDFHDAVHVADLKLPEGCRATESKGNLTVVTIVPPTVLPDEAPAADAAPATSGAPRPKPPLPPRPPLLRRAPLPPRAPQRPRPKAPPRLPSPRRRSKAAHMRQSAVGSRQSPAPIADCRMPTAA